MPGPVKVTTPNDHEIVVTREFDAPRTLIWDCHTDPALMRRWLLGPEGWSMPVCDVDLRVGGAYHYAWRSDADGSQFGFRGEYREIVPGERIVTTERFDTAAPSEDDAVNTLTLVERGGRTTLTQVMRFRTREQRDGALATGMTEGMEASYARLESAVLAGRA